MEMPPLPRRKTIRLQNYDYFQSGAYFVTICTAHRSAILGNIIPPTSHSVGAGPRPARPPRTMTPVGRGDPARRLTGFRPAGRPPLPAAAKEAKRRRGWAPMGVPAHSRSIPGPPEFTGAQFWRPLGRCQAREGQRLPPHPRRCRCRSEIKTA